MSTPQSDTKSEVQATAPTSNPSGASSRPRPKARKKGIQLPFDNRRQDAGSWAYDHRIGLCVTLIAYLVLMIAFVGSKIVIGRRAQQQTIYLDISALEKLEQERDRLLEEVRRKQPNDIDWKSISNRASNENALNESLKDDRGTDAGAINDAAREAQERMQANREIYEQGLAAEQAIRERANQNSDNNQRKETGKVKGSVTVKYSFTNPVRNDRYLKIPAYRCEGGGEVIVEVTVSRRGDVVAAHVREGGDECMREAALSAARASRFDINNKAPNRQTGEISYIFIPQ